MYSDTVFVYRNKAFEPHIIIDVGKLRITPEARTNSSVTYIIHNFLTPQKLFEWGDYIYYEFYYQPDDENEGFSVIASKVNNFRTLFDPEKGLINELDGGPKDILFETLPRRKVFPVISNQKMNDYFNKV